MTLILRILRDNEVVESFPLPGQGRTTFGSDESNDLVLADTLVSSRHFQIQIIGQQAWLEDWPGSAGTLVNGESVSRCTINAGDQVLVGATLICVESDAVPTNYVSNHKLNNLLQGINGGAHLLELGLERGDLSLVRTGWDALARSQNRILDVTRDLVFLQSEYLPKKSEQRLTSILRDVCDEVRQKDLLQYHQGFDFDFNVDPSALLDRDYVAYALRKVVDICEQFGELAESDQNAIKIVVLSSEGQASCRFEIPRVIKTKIETKLKSISQTLEFAVVQKIFVAHAGDFQVRSTNTGVQASLQLACT